MLLRFSEVQKSETISENALFSITSEWKTKLTKLTWKWWKKTWWSWNSDLPDFQCALRGLDLNKHINMQSWQYIWLIQHSLQAVVSFTWLDFEWVAGAHAGRNNLIAKINNIRDMYSTASPAATHSSFPLQRWYIKVSPPTVGLI